MTAVAALETAAAVGTAVVGLPVVAALTVCLATALQPRYRGGHRATRRRPARPPAPAPQRWRHADWRVSRPRHGGVHRRPPRFVIPRTTLSLI